MAVPRGKASVVLGAGTMPSRCAASSFPFRFSPPNRLIAEAFPAKPFELRTDWVDTKLSRVEKQKEPSAQSAARVIAEKRTEIERINFRLQRLLDSLLDGVVERDEYAAEKIKLMSQKKTLEDQNRALSAGRSTWLEPFTEWILSPKNAWENCRFRFASREAGSRLENLRLEPCPRRQHSPWF